MGLTIPVSLEMPTATLTDLSELHPIVEQLNELYAHMGYCILNI